MESRSEDGEPETRKEGNEMSFAFFGRPIPPNAARIGSQNRYAAD